MTVGIEKKPSINLISLISRMNVGGPAVLLSELDEKLPSSHFEHVLVTGRCESNEVDYLSNHTFSGKVIYIDELSRSVSPIRDLFGWLRVRNLINTLNADILHTHTSKAGLLGRTAAILLRRKPLLVHTYHGHLLYGYFPRWKSNLIILFEKFLARFTDTLVAVSEQVRDDLLAHGVGTQSKWRVIHPGVELNEITTVKDARRELKIPDGAFAISWIGRFTDIKDPLLAVEAFLELEAKYPKLFHFTMAGNGELLTAAKARAVTAGSSINFPGWLNNVNTLLTASDILLMTSKNEGMPVVILEAALRGTPTLATDVGGIKDFIKSDETGYLVQRDISQIVNKILEISSNLGYEKVALGAMKLVNKSFSYESYVAEHINMYKNLMYFSKVDK